MVTLQVSRLFSFPVAFPIHFVRVFLVLACAAAGREGLRLYAGALFPLLYYLEGGGRYGIACTLVVIATCRDGLVIRGA